MLESPQIAIVKSVFAMASALPRAREDLEQGAWLSLYQRNTKWDDCGKLQSQARNAIADERRTMARRYAFDKRITLNGLLFDAMENRFPVVAADVQLETYWSHCFQLCDNELIRSVSEARVRTISGPFPPWLVGHIIGTTGKLLEIIRARKRQRSEAHRQY